MSLLRAKYIGVCIIVGLMSFFNIFPMVISLFLFYLLLLIVKAIPLQLAWNRSNFKNLIWMCIATIVFSISIYGFLFFQSGLVKNGELTVVNPLEAIYFSITTWTTLGYGDLTAPEKLYLLTSLEALNGYFAMGIFISLIIIWINEAISTLDDRMSWLRSLKPEEVQAIQDTIDPSIRIFEDDKKDSNTANQPPQKAARLISSVMSQKGSIFQNG